MTTIGKFKISGSNEYRGGIFTVELQSNDVHIIPSHRPADASAPTHRVKVGDVEIGVAWTTIASGNGDVLRLHLDEPSFNGPIYADLVKNRVGDGYTLMRVRDDKSRGGG